MKKIYLLLKTHKSTGLKYLCRHETFNSDTCHKYPGSGIYWRRHLDKHGYDLDTKILAECDSAEEFKNIATHYSNLFDVVDSKEFANLVPEEGQGGSGPAKMRKNHCGWRGFRLTGEDNPSKRKEVRDKISEKLKGRILTDEWKAKLSESAKGRKAWNKGKPNPNARANLEKMNALTTCPHCGKTSTLGAIKRWHMDRCKFVA